MRLTKEYKDGSFGVNDGIPYGENSYEFKEALINKLGACEHNEERIRAEMERLNELRTETDPLSQEWAAYNTRLWTLRWVLNEN